MPDRTLSGWYPRQSRPACARAAPLITGPRANPPNTATSSRPNASLIRWAVARGLRPERKAGKAALGESPISKSRKPAGGFPLF
eukprot:scaffold788_cov231-Pinguiococcus_pyrenoidosus.AAC.3